MMKIDTTRLEATAASLGTMAPDSHCFINKSVLLTSEAETLLTENGRDCFLNSFRLLLRMVKNLTVVGPQDILTAVKSECEEISAGTQPTLQLSAPANLGSFDAILSIGCSARVDVPWTTINSNGWIARVSSRGEKISNVTNQTNPIGALGAASLGVAEVFKRLIALRPERGELSPASSFSFFSYSLSEDPGPPLPKDIPIGLTLFGAGAIGNGVVHLLDRLPLSGFIAIIDRQNFQPENWGTCLKIGPKHFNTPKAKWAADILKSKIRTQWLCGTVEEYVNKCGDEFTYPSIILNGLDNIPARRAVQDLWPDQIIDGAIGPVACEVTLHPWNADASCLLCDFEEPHSSADQLQQRASGLRLTRIKDPSSTIDEADVAAAPPEKRQWLRERKGKEVCSVVSEAVLKTLSAEALEPGFEPSAPFVACLSSCMMVTELVRYVLAWPTILTTGFQFDSLVGPQNGVKKLHHRKADCMCVTKRKNIELIRAKRIALQNQVVNFG